MSTSAIQIKAETGRTPDSVGAINPAPAVERIIGVHSGHNSAAALVEKGELIFAMQEERLTRVKNQGGLPSRVLAEMNGVPVTREGKPLIPRVALGGENLTSCPWRRDDILASWGQGPTALTQLKTAARKSRAISDSINRQKWNSVANELKDVLNVHKVPVRGFNHHLCHAAAAYFGWGKMDEKILVLTCDGAGDQLCASVNVGENGQLSTLAMVDEGHSIGAIYANVTYLLGMVPMEHEYKLMGLAPYAERSRESQALSQQFEALFSFDPQNPMTWRRTKDCPPLLHSTEYLSGLLKRCRFDHVAAGLQLFVERFLARWVSACIAETGIRKVALSGGVFMNVKANQKILNLPELEELFIFPSCGDETNSIGAAWLQHRQSCSTNPDPLADFCLGPQYNDAQIDLAINSYKFQNSAHVQEHRDIESTVAALLARGEIVARFKGRMEFGARALGNRSILANPAMPGVVKTINEMIKCRDFWMPFAPSVLAERSEAYFHKPKPISAPYMIITLDSREEKRNAMAAAIHPYDGTGRPQEVHERWNPSYHRLIRGFEAITGEAVLLNTSFNLHGEPVVSSPQDALRVFDVSGLQHLAIGDFLLSKK